MLTARARRAVKHSNDAHSKGEKGREALERCFLRQR
jgi:hypothetical protein